MHLQEHEMEPQPDYGVDSYKGSGKLQKKVNMRYEYQVCQHAAPLTLFRL